MDEHDGVYTHDGILCSLKKEILTCVPACMDLRNTVHQTQQVKHCMTLLHDTYSRQIHRDRKGDGGDQRLRAGGWGVVKRAESFCRDAENLG